jgi:hypothetical protein
VFDCEGNVYDCLGICGGSTTNCNDCESDSYDCLGICDGNAIEDCMGVCEGTTILDCAGVCGGVAIVDDCGQCTGGTTGKLSNYLKDCAGVCGGNAILDGCGVCDDDLSNDCVTDCVGPHYDCDGNYIECDLLESVYYGLGNGWCDNNSFLSYDCNQYNCDEGDCGEWNGYYCLGGAAIKYDTGLFPERIQNLYYSDPSIPYNYISDYYYESIVGTYYFSYTETNGDPTFYEGYYQTYDQVNAENVCFHLSISIIGPSFYEWFPWFGGTPDCMSYFGYTCEDIDKVECENGDCVSDLEDCGGASRNDNSGEEPPYDKLEQYNKQLEQYNKYLRDKEKEQDIYYIVLIVYYIVPIYHKVVLHHYYHF